MRETEGETPLLAGKKQARLHVLVTLLKQCCEVVQRKISCVTILTAFMATEAQS